MTIFLILFLLLVGVAVVYLVKPSLNLASSILLLPVLFLKSLIDAFKPGNSFYSKRWFGVVVLSLWVALILIELI